MASVELAKNGLNRSNGYVFVRGGKSELDTSSEENIEVLCGSELRSTYFAENTSINLQTQMARHDLLHRLPPERHCPIGGTLLMYEPDKPPG